MSDWPEVTQRSGHRPRLCTCSSWLPGLDWPGRGVPVPAVMRAIAPTQPRLCQRGSVGCSGGGNPRSSTSPAHLDTREWKAWVGGAQSRTQHHCPVPQPLAWPWRGATGQLRLSGSGHRGPLSGARGPAERGSSWAQPRLPSPLTDIYREPSTCQHSAGPRGAAGRKGSRELAGMFPKFLGAPQSSEEACVSPSG